VIRASDLIGCMVRTESGRKLGRVHDLRAHEGEGGWLLMGIVVGSGGMRERLAGAGGEPLEGGDVVAWEAIARLEVGLVVVRDEIAAPAPA
jgi:sporulation protein YlmC with PRC-barrel domain